MQSPWTFKGDGSDSYELPISEVKVGDHVLNVDKTKSNEVVFIEKQEFEGSIYSPDSDMKPFATLYHMLLKDGKWVAGGDNLTIADFAVGGLYTNYCNNPAMSFAKDKWAALLE